MSDCHEALHVAGSDRLAFGLVEPDVFATSPSFASEGLLDLWSVYVQRKRVLELRVRCATCVACGWLVPAGVLRVTCVTGGQRVLGSAVHA